MRATYVLSLVIAMNCACASPDIVLPWSSIEVKSTKTGGVHVLAELGADRQLSRLRIRLGGENIEIPNECRSGLESPLLNGLTIGYGRWNAGNKYWVVKIPYDGTKSVDLGSYMAFVLSKHELIWSYRSVQLDKSTWEDTDICGPYREKMARQQWRLPSSKALQQTFDPASRLVAAERLSASRAAEPGR